MVSWILLVVPSLSNLLRNPSFDVLIFLILVLIATIGYISLGERGRRRREISYRVISDAPVVNAYEAAKGRIRIHVDDQPVESASLLILEVRNSGKEAVEPIDFNPPIRFSFGERTVIWSGILDTEPKHLIDPRKRDVFLWQKKTFVELPRVLLNPNYSLCLEVLLTGDKGEVEAIGSIPNGRITKMAPNRDRIPRRYVLIALTLFLIGVLIPSLLFSSSLSPSPSSNSFNCVSGNVAVSGSSTLYPLMQTVARSYQANCSGAVLTVAQTSSEAGLFDVQAGNIQIASTDRLVSASQFDLVDHNIAVIVFTIIINQDVTGITSLTTKQLQGIYNGTIVNWKQIGGPDLPITVVSLPSTEGIRSTFEKYVLSGSETLPSTIEHPVVDRTDIAAHTVQTTPGAIGYVDLGSATRLGLKIVYINQLAPIPGLVEQNAYKFWAIGHAYTKGNPPSDSLVRAFMQYMDGDYAKAALADLGYISINNIPNGVLSTHH